MSGPAFGSREKRVFRLEFHFFDNHVHNTDITDVLCQVALELNGPHNHFPALN